jgi:hypothetical protein
LPAAAPKSRARFRLQQLKISSSAKVNETGEVANAEPAGSQPRDALDLLYRLKGLVAA